MVDETTADAAGVERWAIGLRSSADGGRDGGGASESAYGAVAEAVEGDSLPAGEEGKMKMGARSLHCSAAAVGDGGRNRPSLRLASSFPAMIVGWEV